MDALRTPAARTLLAALLALCLVSVSPLAAFAADPVPVTPQVSNADWAKWTASMKSRAQAARAPLRSISTKFNNGATTAAKNARAQAARVSISKSAPPTAAAPGKVTVPTKPTVPAAVKPKFGLKMLRGAGNASVGVLGFNLAYSGVRQYVMADMFGLDESSGFICDVRQLAGDMSCAPVADPGYVINSDRTLTAEGWTGSNIAQVYYHPSEVGAPNAPAADVFVEASGVHKGDVTVVMRSDLPAGTPIPVSGGQVMFQSHVGTPQGTTTAQDWGWYMWGGNSPLGPTTITTVRPANSGYYVDHLDLYANGFASPITGTWYPEGHVSRPSAVDPDPLRVWRTTYHCDLGDGGTASAFSDSAQFRESDETWPEYPAGTCEVGTLSAFEVHQLTDGVEPALVYEWELPTEVGDWAAQYPQCTDGSCTLELSRLDDQTGQALACFDNPELCTEWFADPDKTTKYQCSYAGEIVDLTECYLYAPTFTQRLGGGTADPVTGDSPATDNGTVVDPTAPAVSLPGTSIWGSSPNNGGSCPPPLTWSGLISPWWYFQGVKCALIATFVPAEMDAPFLALTDAWGESRIGGMFGAWAGIFDVFDAVDGGGSCKGPGGPMKLQDYDIQFYPLNACGTAVEEYAPMIRGVAQWSAGAFYTMAILNTFAGALGFRLSEPPKDKTS